MSATRNADTHPNQTHRPFSAGAGPGILLTAAVALFLLVARFFASGVLISFLVISSLSPFRGVYRYIDVPGVKHLVFFP